MAYFLGTDEAGYGPNLGPLVISASVWQVPDTVRAEDLYSLLGQVITCSAGRAADRCPSRVAIADSKTLYQSGAGLALLERGVWASLALLGHRPTTWRETWHALAPESGAELPSLIEYAAYDTPVPVDAAAEELAPLGEALGACLAGAGVRLVGLRSRAVFPERFNDLLQRYESKGTALSSLTLELARQVMDPLEKGPITVICDKHGGRDRYAALLGQHFPEWLIEIYGEGRQQSVYRFGPASRRVEFRFHTKAESYLPVALASMASKYLRELAMRALNAFWCSRVPGLEPTAGYPHDALRYKTAIAAVQAEMGIEDRAVWRTK